MTEIDEHIQTPQTVPQTVGPDLAGPAAIRVDRRSASKEPMLGRRGWSAKYARRLAFSDVFVVSLVLIGAHSVRFGPDLLATVVGPSAPPYWLMTVAIGVLWMVALHWTHSREGRILGEGPQEFIRVVRAGWLVLATIAIFGFLTQWQVSRGYLLMALPLGTLVLLGYRYLWRQWIRAQRNRGLLRAQVLVVGNEKSASEMVDRLQRARRTGYNVVGACLPPRAGATDRKEIWGVPILGPLNDPVAQARSVGAEFILLCGSEDMSLTESRRLGWSLEGQGVGLIVAPAIVDVAGPRMVMSPVQGLPLLYVDSPEFSGRKYLLKTAFDVVLTSLMLVILAVPLMMIALAVKLDSPGPALFRQQRLGRGQAPFEMLKFRSMYVDAEQRFEAIAHLNESDGAMFKMRDDPRVTRVGAFLRRLSLDELPQLINVLRGDMSLVGPRPPLLREVDKWEADVARRQLVKPGITGLWQVSGRSSLSWEESVRLDLYYTENWSLAGDLVIVMRTALAVLARRGAY